MAAPVLMSKFYRGHTSMKYQDLSKTLKIGESWISLLLYAIFDRLAASLTNSLEIQDQTPRRKLMTLSDTLWEQSWQ